MTSAHGMWGWGGPFDSIWMLVPLVLMVAFWSLLILLVVKLVRRRPPPTTTRSPALEVLEERYARGEISRDDFLERRSVLSAEATQ